MPEKITKREQRIIEKQKKMQKLKKIGICAVIICIIVSVCVYAYVTKPEPKKHNRTATIETSMGTIKIKLYEDKAPITTANFIELAESGFYDNLTFHRVAKDFVIQGGDPNGDGTGGSGKTIPWEDTSLKNIKYSVSMARSGDPDTVEGANTATSQFFINLKDNQNLDSYTYPFVVFGQVISGTEVVDAIGALYPTEPPYDGHPTTDVIIIGVTISE